MRHGEACARRFGISCEDVVAASENVLDVDDACLEKGSPRGRVFARQEFPAFEIRSCLGREPPARGHAVLVIPRPHDNAMVGFAKPRRRLDQRVKHGLQVERRAADDLEHVGSGGLLLQRFAQLVEQARVLDSA